MRLVDRLTRSIESLAALDPPAELLGTIAERIGMGKRVVRDPLSGTAAGHALHPALIALPVGSWSAALVFDVLPGNEDTAQKLTAFGILSALPAMATGLSDWRYTQGPERRVGLVHAAANTVALSLYAGSYVARRRGHRPLGTALGLAGGASMGFAGWLGGHLTYALGVGVDTTAFSGGGKTWTDVCTADAITEDRLVEQRIDGVSVLLTRVDGNVVALANRCTHRGAPLTDGPREGDCVRCPWHDSLFDLRDGSVKEGPAQRPQPVYDARVISGQVQVRRHALSELQKNSV